MFLIWFVNGMIRIPLFMLALILLLPVAFLFVVVTSPVRIFKKGLHEEMCDKFLRYAHRFLTFIVDGKAQDF